MSKILLLNFVFFLSLCSLAQHEINDTDTTLLFKEKFYTNGEINVSPFIKYFDSTVNMHRVIPKDLFESNIENIDTTNLTLFKEGSWQIEYEKKGKSYYYLAYYEHDELIGKRYDFDSNGKLISTFITYPKIKDSVFNGSQIIEYDKHGKITNIEYIQFNENQTLLFYWNTLRFNKNGVLIRFSFVDEAQNITRFITYSNDGQIIEDYKRDENEWYERKWNKKGTKLKEEIHLKGEKIIRVYRNDNLIKEKIK